MSGALIQQQGAPSQSTSAASAILEGYLRADQRTTDRLFAGLLIIQWFAAVSLALWLTPLTWTGSASAVHLHVKAASSWAAR